MKIHPCVFSCQKNNPSCETCKVTNSSWDSFTSSPKSAQPPSSVFSLLDPYFREEASKTRVNILDDKLSTNRIKLNLQRKS